MSTKQISKPIPIQSLNIDCPRCGALASFDCVNSDNNILSIPHKERTRALRTLIGESHNDWIIRKILRERNFAK